ncbi:phosphomannomutase/phosphoglucomutase [Candidatus Parcubacteria bacterium]|nr:MAG: phosphomannomutase/phosphoglucomutase [Candidatus Parcubacteria bacterium]
MMAFNQKVFRPYDIRGVVDREIDGSFAFAFGFALGQFIKNKKKSGKINMLIGHDARLRSPALSDILINGLSESSKDISVIDMQLCTTPMHFYILNKENFDGGVMVTASHNPKEYVGFKVYGESGEPITLKSGLLQILGLMNKAPQFDLKHHIDDGDVWKKKDYLKEYTDFLFKGVFKLLNPCSIVIDAGNGTAGIVVEQLARRLGLGLIPLFFKPDGNFPNRSPNPLDPMSLEPLRDRIKKTGADFGVAFDGDGDRVVFVDENSKIIEAEQIFAILAKEALRERPGAPIVVPVNISKIVRETVSHSNGKLIVSPVGRTFLIEAMRRQEAAFGGEISGHYYFQEFFGGDAGIFALIKVLKIFSRSQKSFSKLFDGLDKFYKSPEMNITVGDLAGIIWDLKRNYSEAHLVEEIDGLTVEYSDWWFNIRPSNTEPVVRLIVEANTKELLEEKTTELKSFIEKKKGTTQAKP